MSAIFKKSLRKKGGKGEGRGRERKVREETLRKREVENGKRRVFKEEKAVGKKERRERAQKENRGSGIRKRRKSIV